MTNEIVQYNSVIIKTNKREKYCAEIYFLFTKYNYRND